jgi:hypothetical protein
MQTSRPKTNHFSPQPCSLMSSQSDGGGSASQVHLLCLMMFFYLLKAFTAR